MKHSSIDENKINGKVHYFHHYLLFFNIVQFLLVENYDFFYLKNV